MNAIVTAATIRVTMLFVTASAVLERPSTLEAPPSSHAGPQAFDEVVAVGEPPKLSPAFGDVPNVVGESANEAVRLVDERGDEDAERPTSTPRARMKVTPAAAPRRRRP